VANRVSLTCEVRGGEEVSWWTTRESGRVPQCSREGCECRDWRDVATGQLVLKVLLPGCRRFGVLAKPLRADGMDRLLDFELPQLLQSLTSLQLLGTSPELVEKWIGVFFQRQLRAGNNWMLFSSIACCRLATDAVGYCDLENTRWLDNYYHLHQQRWQ
jgi:hypothetical protein